jgi:hypothetical protein
MPTTRAALSVLLPKGENAQSLFTQEKIVMLIAIPTRSPKAPCHSPCVRKGFEHWDEYDFGE